MKKSKVTPFTKPLGEGESLWVVQEWYYDPDRKPTAVGIGKDHWFPCDIRVFLASEAGMHEKLDQMHKDSVNLGHTWSMVTGAKKGSHIFRVRKTTIDSDIFYSM